MAITSTYPIIVPKLTDLIVGTQTYTSADPVLNNPTRNFTVQSIADVVVNSGGTANTIAMFSTSGLTDSLITQAGSIIDIAGNTDITGSLKITNTGPVSILNLISFNSTGGGNYIHAKNSSNENLWVLGANNGNDNRVSLVQYKPNDISISTNGTQAITIKPNGDVGINKTLPGAKLEVGGDIKASGNVAANKVNLLDSNLVPTISATLNVSNNSQAAVFWSQQSECLSLRGGANSNPIQTWRNTSDVILSRIDSIGRLGIQTGTAGLGGYGLTVASGGMNISGNSLITGGNLYFGDNTTTDPNIFNYQDSLHLYAAAGNQIDLGGGIGNRQNNVKIGNGSLYVSSGLKLGNISEYADNAAALTAGLVVGEVYRTVDLLKIVH